MNDVNEQKSRMSMEKLLGSIPLVILAVDQDRRVVYGNISNNTMAKIPLNELAGLEPGNGNNTFVIGEDSRLRYFVEKTMETGEGQTSIEIVRDNQPDTVRTIHVSTVYLSDDSLVIALLQDVTGSRLYYNPGLEKRKLTEMLEKTGKICHDMNQPLQVASGSLDLALLMSESSDKDRELMTEARNQMNRAADIVREMMNLRSVYLRDTETNNNDTEKLNRKII